MIRADDVAPDQVFGIFLPGGLHAANGFVHHRLCRGRFIRLVVSVLAVTDQVDDHIAFKLLAKITGNFHDMVNGFRIIGIDMKDGCMHQLGDRGAIQCRACIFEITGGEAYLVINDNM